jgi:hypothetical protein
MIECHIATAWRERFVLDIIARGKPRLTDAFLWQLSMCRSDAARRLILGVSERIENDEESTRKQ